MAVTQPTYSAGTFDTVNTLSLRKIYNQLQDPHALAMPTLKLLLANKKEDTLGPDEKFGFPIITHYVSPAIGDRNQRYLMDDIDNIIQSQWEPACLTAGVGTNYRDMVHMKTPEALMNHIDIKVDSMHGGMTHSLNYMLYSDWAEAGIGDQIDLNTQLTNLPVPPEELFIKNVSSALDLCYSIPMAARVAVTGHTWGNVAVTTSANGFWNPPTTEYSGATITKSAAGNNIDMVTAITAATCKELDISDLRTQFNKMQYGNRYKIYVACPDTLYGQLEDIITAMNQRMHDDPIADLGIQSYITWDDYNAVFYLEPMMSALWPNSLYMFDPDALYLLIDQDLNPINGTGIQMWERIPGTNMFGTALYMVYQLVCADRRGVGAMHGYKAS
jgi:hypothetical protein